MGPFPTSFGYTYILVGVEYVSKWVEAMPCRATDHKAVLKFLKENIFSRFGVPKAIISDGGPHLCNKPVQRISYLLLSKYGVKHKVATPYQGDQVLLYDSKLHLFLGKLKSRWIGPFIIHQAYPNGSVDLLNLNDNRVFKVNG